MAWVSKMLPLVPNGFLGSGKPTQVPPPPNFRPVLDPRGTCFANAGGFNYTGNTEAQRSGVRYENKVFRFLKKIWPSCRINPLLDFYDGRERRRCRPDVLHFDFEKGLGLIIEVKIQHVPDAWWQLRKLYQPVVSQLYGKHIPLRVMEIVRSYDPAVPFPEEVEVLTRLEDIWDCEKMGVFIWRS